MRHVNFCNNSKENPKVFKKYADIHGTGNKRKKGELNYGYVSITSKVNRFNSKNERH